MHGCNFWFAEAIFASLFYMFMYIYVRPEEQFLEGPQTSLIDRKAYNAPNKTDKYSWG